MLTYAPTHLCPWSLALHQPNKLPVLSLYPVIPAANRGIRSMHSPKSKASMDISCHARRRVRHGSGVDEEEEDDNGHNMEIALLESYTESTREEVLLVRATIDDQEEEVLIFKGFSSSLSFKTSSDPSKSVLPPRAVIKSIDRIKGPFNPTNIEYIERGLSWEAFKPRLNANN